MLFIYISKSGSGRCSDIFRGPQSSTPATYPAFKNARLHMDLQGLPWPLMSGSTPHVSVALYSS